MLGFCLLSCGRIPKPRSERDNDSSGALRVFGTTAGCPMDLDGSLSILEERCSVNPPNVDGFGHRSNDHRRRALVEGLGSRNALEVSVVYGIKTGEEVALRFVPR